LMGAGPIARWKQARLPEIAAQLRWALAVSVATALLLPLATGKWTPMVSLGLLLAVWILATSAVGLRARLAAVAGGAAAKWRSQPRSYYGMLLAHCGVAVFIIGVTLVRGYEVERDVRMAPGDTVALGSYTFRFEGAQDAMGPNYQAMRGTVRVMQGGREITVLAPEKRAYFVQQNTMTEAAIDIGPFRDLYVSLGEPVGNGAWSVRIYYKPFVVWIWAGAAIMALGGLLAISDRRYRLAVRREPAPQAGAIMSGARTT